MVVVVERREAARRPVASRPPVSFVERDCKSKFQALKAYEAHSGTTFAQGAGKFKCNKIKRLRRWCRHLQSCSTGANHHGDDAHAIGGGEILFSLFSLLPKRQQS